MERARRRRIFDTGEDPRLPPPDTTFPLAIQYASRAARNTSRAPCRYPGLQWGFRSWRSHSRHSRGSGNPGTPSLFGFIPYGAVISPSPLPRIKSVAGSSPPPSTLRQAQGTASSGTGRGRNLPPLPPGEGRGEGKERHDTLLQYRYASQCIAGEPPRRANSSIRHSSFRRCRVSMIRRRVSATRRRASSTSRNGSCILCRHSSV